MVSKAQIDHDTKFLQDLVDVHSREIVQAMIALAEKRGRVLVLTITVGPDPDDDVGANLRFRAKQ